MTVRIFGFQLFQSVDCFANCVIHQSRPSGFGSRNQSVEVIDGFSEATLVLNEIVEEEERNHVFEVVGDGPVSEGFKEGFYSSYSLEIWLIEEARTHGA